MSVFARLAPRLQQAVVARLGWSSLRPVQEEAGQALLAGDNVVVLAPTAGGKTEAAIFPALSSLIDDPAEGVGVLYVAPIKALLNNQAERLGLYTEMVGLRRFVWHGDTPDHQRRQFLRDPAELLMTTPESLEVMLISPRVDTAKLFAELRLVVIDEVHALAGTDRGAHLMSVLERLAVLSKNDVQRAGLSATVGNPAAILAWLLGTSRRPGRVVDPPKPPARRQLLVIHRPDQPALAKAAAKLAKNGKSLFFCQTRATTEAVAEDMRRAGTEVFVHHSAVSREERALAEQRFHHGTDACIVCTSTLELGIDVGDLDRVLQAEAPATVSSFLQRMGRTGRRAGQVANTTFFCETSEGVLQAIALIELAREGWVEGVAPSTRCWPVLIHQLLALALEINGVPPEAAWSHFERVADFRGIHRAEFERLVAFMLRDLSLVLTSGRLVLGPKAERRFGRRHFMELYAVFSSPQSYTVQTAHGQDLGTLQQDFVDRLVDGVSSFLLGGRPWAVLLVRHADRRVVVEPAPYGKQPTWGGFLPQFLGHALCRKIGQILAGNETYGYLTAEAATVLATQRETLGELAAGAQGGVESEPGEIRWWTFAGGRINATLRHALEAVRPTWKGVADNFLVRIRGESVDRQSFEEALARIRQPEFWEDDRLWQGVASGLPNYRLSKFQSLMPPWVERETLATYLLDLAGAASYLDGERQPAKRAAETQARLAGATDSELAQLEATPIPARLAPLERDLERPLRWVASDRELAEICAELAGEPMIGLDVETTLESRALCLIQLATANGTYLVDALEISDFAPLASILRDEAIAKVIHNAAFEKSVLSRQGMEIENVVDTLVLSRQRSGKVAEGGHSLKAVCERELGVTLDKVEQKSNWMRRPLTEAQVSYAALDAETVILLYSHFANLASSRG